MNAETLSPALPRAIVEMAVALLRRASSHGLTIAAAESCTGGLLASLLTDIEGASNAFERGCVAYSKQSKCDLLGLSPRMVDDCGPVSEAVARTMSEGALRQSNGSGTCHRERHFGDIGRGATRIACLRVALDMLAEMIDVLAAKRGLSHVS